jgi:serine/threonine protein kinase
MKNTVFIKKGHFRYIQQEVEILRLLSEYKFDFINNFTSFDEYRITFPKIQGEDLYEFIKNNYSASIFTNSFDEYLNDVYKIYSQVLDAVHYLHDKDIFHMDLKPENIMMDPSLKIYVIDFGQSVQVEKGVLLTDYRRGTPAYRSPELIFRQPYLPEKHDIWCLGIMLFDLITYCVPFGNLQTCSYYPDFKEQGAIILEKYFDLEEFAYIIPYLDLCLCDPQYKRKSVEHLRSAFNSAIQES